MATQTIPEIGSSEPEAKPSETHIAKVTSKGQVTIPIEIRRALGVEAGDQLIFERTADGVRIVKRRDPNRFEQFRGIGNGIPELDHGGREAIRRYMHEMRGHDEYDIRLSEEQ
jgi:AbrB family looped-hinge helix DNA binding protein